MSNYNHRKIESKWQKYWQTKKTFIAKDFSAKGGSASGGSKKPKKYVLVEFPYPSGAGLHMGHLRPYVAADVYARFNRMNGFETIFPIGWDAFGLPAENYAIKMGVHPSKATVQNVKNAKKQIQSWGLSFDWSREINTTDPNYYKWTQWLFLQFYKAGLAYEATGLINWCPKDKTGLANEEVIDGKCERCGTVVEKKELRQWYLKITAYAEKLLEGLKTLDQWPEAVKLQQENWIGKSTGAEIDFPIKDLGLMIQVFTTRPDTIFGATYMVLAPEHPIVQNLKSDITNFQEVQNYINTAKSKTEIDRTSEGKEKTGVELKGVKAINPATKQEIPVWVADYVLWGYGTGAIMAVPAHDERDFEFAKKFNLPIKQVIKSPEVMPRSPLESPALSAGAYGHLDNSTAEVCWTGDGVLINSGQFNQMASEQAIPKMAAAFGKATIQYKLRDWVFSRQRYWGEPIPIIHCPKCGIVPVPEKDLPVKLPPVKKYEPTGTGESPLADIKAWVNVKCPVCKSPAKRETNTMPQWAGSSWYWLRYTDPKNKKSFADLKKQKYWTPVDVYFGGMEHTTLHLLYSRFWNLFLYDQKLVTSREPFTLRKPHGIILGPDGEKMSKSRGNVVNPQDIVASHGADTLRMFELFLGPHEDTIAWNDKSVVGVKRFLDRVWSWVNVAEATGLQNKDNDKVNRAINKLTKKITEDIVTFHFNTCVSAFMGFLNEVKDEPVSLETVKTYLKLLYPFIPHISEELNQLISGSANKRVSSLQTESWPKFTEALTIDKTVEMVVQVNGKVKGKMTIITGSLQPQVELTAKELEGVKQALAGQTIKRTIFVPGRLINFVV